MELLRAAARPPDEAPDSAFEFRQSSGGPRMTRSTALRVPTACARHDKTDCMLNSSPKTNHLAA